MTRKELVTPCCGNGAFGRFEMTSHKPPRFRLEDGAIISGKCTFDVVPIFEEYKAKMPLVAFQGHWSNVRVPNMDMGIEPDYYEDCSCWRPHEEACDELTYANITPFPVMEEL